MKKNLFKKICLVLLFLLFLPLFFSCEARAEELPVATGSDADLSFLADPPLEKFFDFGYVYKVDQDQSTFGRFIDLCFNFPVQFDYISWYLKKQPDFQAALSSGQLSLSEFSGLQRSYELAWIHVLLQSVLSFMVFTALFKVVRSKLG